MRTRIFDLERVAKYVDVRTTILNLERVTKYWDVKTRIYYQ